jgi:ubiquinone/menaquinone biosynthesis C-methylase UbiE
MTDWGCDEVLDVRTALAGIVRSTLGAGWMYRLPRRYQREIETRFADARQEAFSYFVETRRAELAEKRTCLDLACGTGLTSLWMAAACPQLDIVGIDASRRMLSHARREAKRRGLADRCTFITGDVRSITGEELRERVPGWSGAADIVTCALGFSVVPSWDKAFENTCSLLDRDGFYVVFDQYSPGLVVHDFAADQSRESWKLVERTFRESETTWFGREFIAIGHGRLPGGT